MKKASYIKLTKSNKLLLACFIVFSFHFNSYSQTKPLYKIKKKDSVLCIKKPLKKSKKEKTIAFNGHDGPYIINDTLYRVNNTNELEILPNFNRDSVLVRVDNKDNNKFYLSLDTNYKIPEHTYNLPEKMVVVSDIEGNYNAFAGFLYANKIIDENHNWIYKNGHLVLGGDFVDRGKNVTQILWLIYKLEQQAREQNGVVHFILGNHEILNFYGDYRYNRGKYIKAALQISKLKKKKEAIKYLYSNKTELGKWLATKNVVEKIGDYIFVHAGLSPDILKFKLNLEDINNIVRSQFNGFTYTKDPIINFLYSSQGPFWYRGLILDRKSTAKITNQQLQAILEYYNAKKIVIGHTTVENVSTDFNGQIIRSDVHHGNTMFSGKTKGLLVENGNEFILNDKAIKLPLH